MTAKSSFCDFPLLEYGHETGRLINIILKLIFQRAWLRRESRGIAQPGLPLAGRIPVFRDAPGQLLSADLPGQPRRGRLPDTEHPQPLGGTGRGAARLKDQELLRQSRDQDCPPAERARHSHLHGRHHRQGIPVSWTAIMPADRNGQAPMRASGVRSSSSTSSSPSSFHGSPSPTPPIPTQKRSSISRASRLTPPRQTRNPKGRNYLRVLFSREI